MKRHSILKSIFFILVACIIFNNCSEEVKEKGLYNIDSTKIAPLIIDSTLNVAFNPPLRWLSADSEVSDKITRQMAYAKRNYVDYIYSASNLFFDPGSRSVLNVGEVQLRKNDSTVVPDLDKYIKQSTAKFRNAEVKTDKISLNNIEFTRIEVFYGVWYTYRLLFNNREGNLLQFEYSTQQKYADAEKLAIESSVGTIKLL